MSKITLKVDGMTCQHCVMHVKKALEEFESVSDVAVSLEEGRAEFTCSDEAPDLNAFTSAIEEAGYSATPA